MHLSGSPFRYDDKFTKCKDPIVRKCGVLLPPIPELRPCNADIPRLDSLASNMDGLRAGARKIPLAMIGHHSGIGEIFVAADRYQKPVRKSEIGPTVFVG